MRRRGRHRRHVRCGDEILAQYVLTYIRPELPADTESIGIAREDVTVRVTPVL